MKTHNTKQRIKATYTMLPLIGCPGAEGASWVLPADAESYERMVEQVRRKICLAHRVFPKATIGWTNGLEYKSDARAALRAIGITAPKKGRK